MLPFCSYYYLHGVCRNPIIVVIIIIIIIIITFSAILWKSPCRTWFRNWILLWVTYLKCTNKNSTWLYLHDWISRKGQSNSWVLSKVFLYLLSQQWSKTTLNLFLVFRLVRNITKKRIITFVTSVYPSIRMEQLSSHWSDFHTILSMFRKSVEKIQVSLIL